MEKLGDGVKKVLLAGIGAVAVTAEKSRELLDEMVKKGELTVEQGKVLNEELKHNIKKTVKENVNVSVKPSSAEELEELVSQMTPEMLARLKEQIARKEAEVKADLNEEVDGARDEYKGIRRIRCPIKRDDLCTAQAWHNQRGDSGKTPDDTGRSGTNFY